MKGIRTLGIWYLLLQKRLFKKISFLLILCMVPCLVLGVRLASEGENHILRIVLYAPESDVIGQKVIEELMGEESVIGYEAARSKEAAQELFYQGKADAAWLFEKPLQELIQAGEAQNIQSIVKVLQREDSMQLRLAKVKLYTAMYPFYVYEVYDHLAHTTLDEKDLSEEEIRSHFEDAFVEGSIFEMHYMDVEEKVEEDSDYLMSPMRGMMALWLMLAGLASAVYFLQDEKEGLFAWVPVRQRYLLSCAYHLTAVSDAAAVLLFTCFLTKNTVSWRRELVSLFLFVCMATGFCVLLQMICGSAGRLGSVIPVLMIGMLAFCPVFLNLRKFHALQCLLPPYHYLQSLHNVRSLADMMIYVAAVFGTGFAVFWIKTKKCS